MRILLVTEDVPAPMLGGAGQHAVVLGNALLDAGHEVHLLGYRNDDGAGCDFRGPLHPLIDFRGARWSEGRFGVFMPMTRPHMARRIWQAVQGLPGPWDVVHYHGHDPLLGTLVPASWNYLHTLHDQGAECITKLRFKDGAVCSARDAHDCAGCAAPRPNAVQHWLSAQAVLGLRGGALRAYRRHKAVFVSDFVRRQFCWAQGVQLHDFNGHVVHNFVDPLRLRAARTLEHRPPGPLRVFAAGRIDAAKGFGAWLAALDDALLQRLEVSIAGDGPELPALKQQHAGRGVRFLGWQTSADTLAHTARADVVVVPSVLQEACATTVLEALSLGRTVLALHRGGTPELAVYGEPGQLLLFDEMAPLCAALGTLQRHDWPCHERAAVQSRLPQLLDLYRAPRLQSVPEGAVA